MLGTDLRKKTSLDKLESNGKIIVEEDAVLGFLEVLDRRRYELELVKGSSERFKAASRSRLRDLAERNNDREVEILLRLQRLGNTLAWGFARTLANCAGLCGVHAKARQE